MHTNTHANFVPDLDMNPPPAWSKPATALGLSNPLHHLPQSQQVRRLQQQIQQHRQLQHQQSQGGYGLGAHLSKKKKNNNGGDPAQQQHRHDRQEYQMQHPFGGGGGGGGGGLQHISIKSDDMNSDEEVDEDDEDDAKSNNEFGDRGNKGDKGSRGNKVQQDRDSSDREIRMPGLHHRSLSHPHLTQGFTIPVSSGFTGFGGQGPTSPLSPGSPGSTTSEANSITASMLSPGLMTSSNQSYYGHHGHNNSSGNNGLQGIESSLASLASLSVLSAAAGGSPTSVMPISMPMSSRGGRHHGLQGNNNLATTPTTSSFQPQSLPMMYHTGHNNTGVFMPTTTAMASAGSQGPSFNAFSTALTQHFQRQQQQQQEQMTSAALSSSLPVHSFSQFQQQQQQHQLQQQQQQQQQQSIQQDQSSQQKQHQRSRSKSLTLPAPRIIPPTRVIPPRPPQTSAPRKYHGRQTRKLPSAAPAVPKEDVDPTRRVAHIISEQKRREKINGGFDELKSVIPECAQNTDSKATILRKAVDYILLLEDELRKYTDVYQMEAGGEDPESSLEGHERER
ncbi:hypothetical protein EMPS_06286 [Entomortierella parvispora]|uniref:BHLH domain-containing protein n=1 Tax=Entomortierella parvispora TaxID=205924 RepID=A0A9P3LXB4_9FUNG|nr:hypothetical protein EMPS_06286 [Entomortierella parvispora]